jgi:hypothetical protein
MNHLHQQPGVFWSILTTTISLEMPVPSQGHYGFTVFRLLTDFFLFIYLWVLTFPLEDCSKFSNFVITLFLICCKFCIIQVTLDWFYISYNALIYRFALLHVWLQAIVSFNLLPQWIHCLWNLKGAHLSRNSFKWFNWSYKKFCLFFSLLFGSFISNWILTWNFWNWP